MTTVWNHTLQGVHASQANMQAVVWEKENSRTAGYEDRNMMSTGAGLLRHPRPRRGWMSAVQDQASVRQTRGAQAPLPESTVHDRLEVNSMEESQLPAPPQIHEIQSYWMTAKRDHRSIRSRLDDELDTYQYKGMHAKRESKPTKRAGSVSLVKSKLAVEMPLVSGSESIGKVTWTARDAARSSAPTNSSKPTPLHHDDASQQRPVSLPTPPYSQSSSSQSPEHGSPQSTTSSKGANASTPSAPSTSVTIASSHHCAASQQRPASLPTPPRTDSSSSESSGHTSPESATSLESVNASASTSSKWPTYGVRAAVEPEGSSPPSIPEVLSPPIHRQRLPGIIQPGSIQKTLELATLSSRPIRDKIAQACERCKKAHAKCSGPVENGDCTKCDKSHKECVWVKRGSIRKVESQEEIELVNKSLEADSGESRGFADDGQGSTAGKVKRKGSKNGVDNGAAVAPKNGAARKKRNETGVERVSKFKNARSSPYRRSSPSPKAARKCDIPADNQAAPKASYPADPILPQGTTDSIIDYSTSVPTAVPLAPQVHDIAVTPAYPCYQQFGEIGLTVDDAETAVPTAAPLVRQDTDDIAVMPTFASHQQPGVIDLTADDPKTAVPPAVPPLQQDKHDGAIMPTDPYHQQSGMMDMHMAVDDVATAVPPAIDPMRQDIHDFGILPTYPPYQQAGMTMTVDNAEAAIPPSVLPLEQVTHEFDILPTSPWRQQFGMTELIPANGESAVPPPLPPVPQDLYDMGIQLAAPLDMPLLKQQVDEILTGRWFGEVA